MGEFLSRLLVVGLIPVIYTVHLVFAEIRCVGKRERADQDQAEVNWVVHTRRQVKFLEKWRKSRSDVSV